MVYALLIHIKIILVSIDGTAFVEVIRPCG
jgi:hypothetical protein